MAKILVVDDHPINRQFLVKLLGYFKHEIVEAADGIEGLAMAQASCPDVIITDIIMPRMDGATFAKEVRANPALAGIPIVFYTASQRVSNALALADECKVAHVLYKPAKPDEILRILNAVLGSASPREIPIADTESLRLAALSELGLDLTTECHPERLLKKFCLAIQYILSAASAGVLIFDEPGSKVCYAEVTRREGNHMALPNAQRTADLLRGMLGSQLVVRWKCPELDPSELGLEAPVQSLLAAAIASSGPPFQTGCLYAANKLGVSEFTSEDERLATTLAMQVVVANRNAHLQQSIQKHVLELEQEVEQRRQAEASLQERSRLAALSADVGIALTHSDTLWQMLQLCTESMVKNLGAAFARIWTLNPTQDVLELQASAGRYTHLDGPHSRVPVGQFKIGMIAQERKPHLTNDVCNDPRVSDREWARREGMIAFAGYPLLVEDQLIGVIALFAQHQLSQTTIEAMAAVANQIALGISHRKSQESLRLFRTLIDRSNDGIEVIDPETGRFLDINGRTCERLGYSRDELLALGVPDIETTAVDRSSWANNVEEIRQSGFKIIEGRHRRKDGTTFPIEVNVKYIHLDQGYLLAIVRDITERKRAEESLRETNELLQSLVQASPLAIIAIDRDTNVLRWNQAAERIFGWREAEVVGGSLPIVPVDQQQQFRALHEAELKGESHPGLETHRIRKDGTRVDVNVWTAPLHDGKGEMIGRLQMFADVTEYKRLQEQFRQAQKMEAIGRLAGGVAHDFNNLLTVILGYSEHMLSRLQQGDPLRNFVEQIQKAGHQAEALTRQLLAFSRQQVVAPQVLSLNTIVTDLAKMLRRLLGEDIGLTTTLDPQLRLVKMDPGQVNQVLMNLVVNARDAMPQYGQLTIETSNAELDASYSRSHPEVQPGLYVLLAVSDTGCGMDEHTKTRIFEPFFTTKENGKGTGLGLATVFGIVKQCNGHISVYSELDHGTTFKIYLPPAAPGDKPAAARKSDGLSVRGTETVLVAEDNEALRKLMKETLSFYGYQVLEAQNGGEALLLCESHVGPIHILVSDVVMPLMSGRELAERLVRLKPEIKVLYVSGYTADAVVRHGLLTAEVAFLQKPFLPTALARKVREVLDK